MGERVGGEARSPILRRLPRRLRWTRDSLRDPLLRPHALRKRLSIALYVAVGAHGPRHPAIASVVPPLGCG
jgi:hypothetical protein